MLEMFDSQLLDCLDTNSESKDDQHHVLLNNQKEGVFICPACDNSVVRDLSQFAKAKVAVRVKCTCKCGHTFRVLVERRRNARKSVNLVGMCHFLDNSKKTKKRLIKVHDISFTGLQFSVNGSPEFRVGDKIIVDFRLNDRTRSEVKEKGTIVRIKQKNVGIQFESSQRCRPLMLFLTK
mgnify:FL=1